MVTEKEKEAAVEATMDHRAKVVSYLGEICNSLMERGAAHDQSKLEEPELSLFAEWGPRLKQMEYGSQEYKDALSTMGAALKHHYEHNRHHPEHFEQRVDGMTLVDLVEMVADWRAAAHRMAQGGENADDISMFLTSLATNAKRFKLDPQLVNILANTARSWK
jgi:hypothetical protein